jgi:hypothetical protein
MYAAESTITEAKDRERNWFDASESSVTLPNVHIKISLLTALMQADKIGKPPAVVTTKYSVRRRSNTLTKLP